MLITGILLQNLWQNNTVEYYSPIRNCGHLYTFYLHWSLFYKASMTFAQPPIIRTMTKRNPRSSQPRQWRVQVETGGWRTTGGIFYKENYMYIYIHTLYIILSIYIHTHIYTITIYTFIYTYTLSLQIYIKRYRYVLIFHLHL